MSIQFGKKINMYGVGEYYRGRGTIQENHQQLSSSNAFLYACHLDSAVVVLPVHIQNTGGFPYRQGLPQAVIYNRCLSRAMINNGLPTSARFSANASDKVAGSNIQQNLLHF